jgi:HlyD family secretion protein
MRRVVIGGLSLVLPALLAVAVVAPRLSSRARRQAGPRTFVVRRGDLLVRVTETGTVEALSKVEVKSKVGGKVLQLRVAEGNRVQAGQVLAILDPIEQQSQVGQIRAQVAAARARLRQAVAQAATERDTVALGIADARQQLLAARARLAQARRQAAVQPKLTRMAVAQSGASDLAARQVLQRLQRSGSPQALAEALSSFDQAKADCDLAEKGLARQRALLGRGFVPQSSVDEAERQAATARARLVAAASRFSTVREQIEADRLEAEARVTQSSAALEAARANQVQDALRQDDVASTQAALDSARVALERAITQKAQLTVRDAEVDAARASVAQLENSLEEVETRLRDTILRAPMAGVVTKRYVEEGELVTSGIQTFSSGTPLLQIADLRRMQVRVQVNEVDVARLRVGQRARIELDASRGAWLPGRVKAVAPASVAAPSAATQGGGAGSSGGGIVKFEVKIDILKRDPRLRPGMSANVDIITDERHNVLLLPLEAVDLGAARVKRNVGGKAVETPVALGLRGENQIEIRSGLREGDIVFAARYTGPPRRRLDMRPGGQGG